MVRLRLEMPAVRGYGPEPFLFTTSRWGGCRTIASAVVSTSSIHHLVASKLLYFSVGKHERAKTASLRLGFDGKFRANSLITLYQLQLRPVTLFQTVS